MKKIMSAILALIICIGAILSLGACASTPDHCIYFGQRDTEGRDIHYVKIEYKDYGDVYVLLDGTSAPETVKNFLYHVNQGFYTNLTMHRIIENFMIQGGDPDANGIGGSKHTVYGEFSANGYKKNDILHYRGVISMARTANDPNSASSQFFICNADANSSLDGNYAAFGYVIKGMSAVDKITKSTVKYTDSESGTIADVSKQAVILSITEISEAEALAAAKK